MKKIIPLIIIILICQILVQPVYALKKRASIKNKSTSINTSMSFSKAKLSRNTNSLIVSFLNLDKTIKVDYELTYYANSVPQGAIGSITPSNPTDSRDLYFGTCSKGVCTPHRNITNAVLIIKTTLKSGGINTKRYRIKI